MPRGGRELMPVSMTSHLHQGLVKFLKPKTKEATTQLHTSPYSLRYSFL